MLPYHRMTERFVSPPPTPTSLPYLHPLHSTLVLRGSPELTWTLTVPSSSPFLLPYFTVPLPDVLVPPEDLPSPTPRLGPFPSSVTLS